MIWRVIQNLIAFYVLFKAIKSYKNLKKLAQKLKHTPIKNVQQIKQLLKSKKPFQKMFVIIKGIAQSSAKYGDKDIVSLVQQIPLRTKQSLINLTQKINWQNIIEKSFWRRPWNFANIKFSLKDIINPNQTVQISNCSTTDISGGLSQILSDVIIYQQTKNPFLRFMKSFYNFIINYSPIKLFLNKTKVGDQLKYYGILQGQYLLSIGQIFKTTEGQIKMQNPYYITKQKGYLTQRIQRKMNFLYWLSLTIFISWVYFFYGLISQLIKKYYDLKSKRKFEEEQEQRSDDQGEFANCIICYTNIRTIVLKPCKHYAFCQQCYNNIKETTCPVCKAQIQGILKIVKKKNNK